MFTRGIAVELSKYGIRANCFAPGTTNTDMVGESARERFPHYTAKRLVIPRMAKPEEQAAVALFLASDDASYMSGRDRIQRRRMGYLLNNFYFMKSKIHIFLIEKGNECYEMHKRRVEKIK